MLTAERKNNTLTLSQQRFTYLPNDAAQTWLVPVTVNQYSDDIAPDLVHPVLGETVGRLRSRVDDTGVRRLESETSASMLHPATGLPGRAA